MNKLWPANWYCYVVECSDDSLYTGITTDPTRRVEEHNSSRKGARYTRGRRPVKLLMAEECSSQSEAARIERHIKSLSHADKWWHVHEVRHRLGISKPRIAGWKEFAQMMPQH